MSSNIENINPEEMTVTELRKLLLFCNSWDNGLRTYNKVGLVKTFKSDLISPHHKYEFIENLKHYSYLYLDLD